MEKEGHGEKRTFPEIVPRGDKTVISCICESLVSIWIQIAGECDPGVH